MKYETVIYEQFNYDFAELKKLIEGKIHDGWAVHNMWTIEGTTIITYVK